eukprot:m.662678 g.662678  ORF g.662678 m.662678 type:complete len:1576 (+) comp58477_c0_seq2:48-4775(+)
MSAQLDVDDDYLAVGEGLQLNPLRDQHLAAQRPPAATPPANPTPTPSAATTAETSIDISASPSPAPKHVRMSAGEVKNSLMHSPSFETQPVKSALKHEREHRDVVKLINSKVIEVKSIEVPRPKLYSELFLVAGVYTRQQRLDLIEQSVKVAECLEPRSLHFKFDHDVNPADLRLCCAVVGKQVKDAHSVLLGWINVTFQDDYLDDKHGLEVLSMWKSRSEQHGLHQWLRPEEHDGENDDMSDSSWLTIVWDPEVAMPLSVESRKHQLIEDLLKMEPSHQKYRLAKALKMTGEFIRLHNIRRRSIGVAWKNLRVIATVNANAEVSTVVGALRGMVCANKKTEKVLLDNLTGYIEPGETLLLVGRPGAGCTTFLNLLSGHVDSNLTVEGQILYNGSSDGSSYAKATRLVKEDDIHIGNLTVEETLLIASELATPLEYPNRSEVIQIHVRNLMQLLGLYHVRKTVVGDALTRGVSGGERRRVTIAEALTSRPNFLLLDDYTKGLDALVSLQMMKLIRTVARVMGITVVAAQYQPSQEIFEHFDKVCVLAEGKCLYFGPTSDALPYFEGLGISCPARRTVADFLVSLGTKLVTATPSSSNSDLSMAGSEADLTSLTPQVAPDSINDLAEAYRGSPQAQAVSVRVDAGVNLEGATSGKESQDFLTQPQYVPKRTQLSVLLKREWLLLTNQPQAMISRVVRFVILATLCGALFLRLDLQYPNGAYSRSGLAYFGLVLIGLSVMSQIPLILLKRDILYKHRDYRIYDGFAYFLSNIFLDLPFLLLESLAFITVLFWMADLNDTEHGFRYFYAWLVLACCEFAMGNMIRMLACGFKDIASVQAVAPAIAIIFVFFCGFIISEPKIPPWFIWIHYLSPLTYAFQGLMIDIFAGLEFKPVTPGLPVITGEFYLKENFGIEYADLESFKWGILPLLVAFGVVFSMAAVWLLNHRRFDSESRQLQYKVHPAWRLRRRERRRSMSKKSKRGPGDVPPAILVWRKLSYSVNLPVKRGQAVMSKKLLDEVNGYVRPGQLLALMGSSGAGKSTLLDVVALRKTGGTITGSVQLNGQDVDQTFVPLTGYVEQFHVLPQRATVREVLSFAVEMKLPLSLTFLEKDDAINRAVRLLQLENVQNAIIGSPELGTGLSHETNKRVGIASEIVSRPPVLFLDEPTSGLDSVGALNVMTVIRDVANAGHAVVSTIHQPAAELFEMFDTLLLLQKGGHTAYFGPLGPHSETLVGYLTRHGAAALQERENPADYMLREIAVQRGELDWSTIWTKSPECYEVVSAVTSPNFVPPDVHPIFRNANEYPGNYQQFAHIFGRTFRTFWRDPSYNLTRQIFQLGVALLLGLTFLQLAHDQAGLNSRISAIFFASVLAVTTMVGATGPLFQERALFYREHDSATYTLTPFLAAAGIVEIPFLAFGTTIFCAVFYWLVGFREDGFGYFYVMMFAYQFFAVSLGQVLAAASSSRAAAQQAIPALNSFLNLFCGFLIRKQDIGGWFIWIYYINPLTYFIEGIVTNEVGGQVFEGDASKGAFTTGDAFLSFYGMDYDHRWRNVGIVFAFTIFLRILLFALFKYKRHQTR